MTPNERFLHRLALALHRSVNELLDTLTYRELVDWGVHYKSEPWGDLRADVRSAQIAMILANTNRDPKKRPEPYKLVDFMPFNKSSAEEAPAEKQVGAKTDPALIAWMFNKSGARMKG